MFVCSTAVTILPRLDFKTEAFFMKENKKKPVSIVKQHHD